MSKTININVHHVTRVEGHGNIVVNATDGKIEKFEWQVPEAPRFFEAMVRGRHFDDIQIIVSRICGICSITHSLAATKAVEKALGVRSYRTGGYASPAYALFRAAAKSCSSCRLSGRS